MTGVMKMSGIFFCLYL